MAELDVMNRVCRKFNVKSLTEQQISAIDALKRGRDTFLGTKTGSGKSLVYESSPIVLGENGVTTVIAPLNSIMSEQIERLNKLGYRAVQISNDTDREAVTNGYFQFVFGSPEYLVGDDKWRDVLRSPIFTPKHHLIVVDEAHTVIQCKTSDATKEKNRKDMLEGNGKIRVLICTNAAGMGVNFQNVNNIVHYGPPRDLDNLVQQMGRAGRDGTQSNELIIYKANQLKKVDDDVIKLLKSTVSCRRKIINEAYIQKHARASDHFCCDICELVCECESDNCPSTHSAKDVILNFRDEENELEMQREVGEEEKAIVQQRLHSLKDSILEGTKSFIHSDIVCGFFVDEIIAKLPCLFTVNDVLDKTSVDSLALANSIVQIITEIFNDNEMYALEEIGSDS